MKKIPFVGKVIRRLRLEAKMTQEDLCAATDYILTVSYLSQLERKPISFLWSIFDAVCDALSVDIVDVINEARNGLVLAEPGKTATAQPKPRVIRVIDMNGDDVDVHLPVNHRMPADSFGYLIDTISMESSRGGVSYFRGGIALVSPGSSVNNGDDCLIFIDDVYILGRYEFDGRGHWLTYLNQSYPREIIASQSMIVGRVVGFSWSVKDI